MRSTTIGVTGSLRLVGVTVAVAAGIAGFASPAAPALAEAGVPEQACDHVSDRASSPAAGLAPCTAVVVPDGLVSGDTAAAPIIG
jgi:hypothetical protein